MAFAGFCLSFAAFAVFAGFWGSGPMLLRTLAGLALGCLAMVVQASRETGFAGFAVSGMSFAGFCLSFAAFAGFWGSGPRLLRTLAGLASCLAMVVQASRETGFAAFAV